MRIVIVPEDRKVSVDGDVTEFNFNIDPDIHAVQWYGDRGVIEYKSKPQVKINSFVDFEHLLVERTNAIAQQEQDRLDAIAAAEAALTPQEKRVREYPSVQDQLEALYDARQGDPSKLNQIDAQIQAVKLKYPKEVTPL